jgi:hypothetical protein
MGGQSLIYSFVASGTNVLAEYTAFNGNFSTIAVQCLQKLPANNNKFTYTCDHHTFNYLVDDGYSTFFFLSLSLSLSILLVPRRFWQGHSANAECIVVIPQVIRPEIRLQRKINITIVFLFLSDVFSAPSEIEDHLL